jgi:hypothetical protein
MAGKPIEINTYGLSDGWKDRQIGRQTEDRKTGGQKDRHTLDNYAVRQF